MTHKQLLTYLNIYEDIARGEKPCRIIAVPGKHERWKETWISLAASVFAHRLPQMYFERTDRTTAEGTFILDRAVCLLDIVDEEWRTDVFDRGAIQFCLFTLRNMLGQKFIYFVCSS